MHTTLRTGICATALWLAFSAQLLLAHEGTHGAGPEGKGTFQDFPALCVNAKGDAYVAYVDRPADAGPRLIVAAHHQGGDLEPVGTVADEGITAFDSPALAPTGDGCLLVFSAEI